MYVINQGTCPTAGCGTGTNTGQSIALYSVGGDGVLTFQESYVSQGYDSLWAQMDSTGTYLYVLDKYSPGVNAHERPLQRPRTPTATARSPRLWRIPTPAA